MLRFLFLLTFFPALLYSQNQRLYQFKSGEKNDSFFIVEVGNLYPPLDMNNKRFKNEYSSIQDLGSDSIIVLGDIFSDPYLMLSLHNKGVELSGGWFFLQNKVGLSSDLYVFNYEIDKSLSLNIGVGGGIIFSSSVEEGLHSDILLRAPVRFVSNNFFMKFNTMIGVTMFEMFPKYRLNISFDIGYMFDLYREPKKTPKK